MSEWSISLPHTYGHGRSVLLFLLLRQLLSINKIYTYSNLFFYLLSFSQISENHRSLSYFAFGSCTKLRSRSIQFGSIFLRRLGAILVVLYMIYEYEYIRREKKRIWLEKNIIVCCHAHIPCYRDHDRAELIRALDEETLTRLNQITWLLAFNHVFKLTLVNTSLLQLLFPLQRTPLHLLFNDHSAEECLDDCEDVCRLYSYASRERQRFP